MSETGPGAATFLLEGRRILCTGASRGIGAVVARSLARHRARLVLVARDRKALEALAGELEGGPHEILELDVADEAAWAAASTAVINHDRLDGLVCAAGILGPIGPIGSFAPSAFRRTLEVNLIGTLLAVEACLAALLASSGAIVTFSGGGATGPFPRFDAYAASKAAVVRLTENLAEELAPQKVRANAVAPGFVTTAMHDATLAAGESRVGSAYFQRTLEMIRSGGDPPELAAELTAFLLSPRAAKVTGKLISARWDPWRDEEFLRRLETERDFATLRRIDDQFFQRVVAR